MVSSVPPAIIEKIEKFGKTINQLNNYFASLDYLKNSLKRAGYLSQSQLRSVRKNDEIGVEHSLVSFNDGNTEAVMAVFKYQDGKMISLETGATKIPK